MQQPFNLVFDLNHIPYMAKVTPCEYNGEIQYRVSVNGNEEVMFVFDNAVGRYSAEGSNAITIPDDAELEIGNRLNSQSMKDGANS